MFFGSSLIGLLTVGLSVGIVRALEVHQWNTTAGNNQFAVPDGWPENQAPSSVNNAAREDMAVLARWSSDISGSLVSGGSGTAYEVTPNRDVTAYHDGYTLVWEAHTANTGAATLAATSGVGAQSIVKHFNIALAASDIVASQ
ncbi:MAG: hypothetical protein IH987_17730, partial [Planctomycetes bacterium]|nr:hypothetical protein [Planctomycetota bacterium]